MTVVGGIILLMLIGYGLSSLIRMIGMIVNKIRERNQESDGEQSDLPDDVANVAFKIMKKSLEKIGCKPEVEKDGATINFAYQGEHFVASCNGLWARIWDPAWSALKTDDPNLDHALHAVNSANVKIFPAIVMCADEENNILFHSRMDIMLHPSLPQKEEYVKSILGTFFQAKEAVRAEYQNIGIGKQMEQKKRRKVGFRQPGDDEQDDTRE